MWFEHGAGLTVDDGGSLNASGTADAPILFTGVDPHPGHWDGIWYRDSEHPSNRLEHAVIEYGGQEAYHGSVEAAGLTLARSRRNTSVAIFNVVLQHNQNRGFHASGNAELTEFEDNTITHNDRSGRIRAGHIEAIDGSSSFTDNEEDELLVDGGEIEDESTISALDVAYEVTGDITTSAATTIEAGVEMYFDAETKFRVAEEAFVIEGTADAPVLFSGTDPSPGWWEGLWIRTSEHPNNSIDHLIVEHAGSSAHHGSVEPAGLTVTRSRRDASVAVTNSTFRDNEDYGIYVNSNGELTDFQNNTFEDNAELGLSLHANQLDALDRDSQFDGNGTDAVELRGGTIPGDTEWKDPGVPFHVLGDLSTDDNADMTVDPGVHARFDADIYLRSDGDGVLIAEGTSDDPIVFEGLEQNGGWWRGIWVRTTPNNKPAVLDHVEVRHAGSAEHHGSTEPAGVTVTRSRRDADAEVTNTTIEDITNSATDAYGIWVNSNGVVNDDICDDGVNTFNNIDGPDCFIED